MKLNSTYDYIATSYKYTYKSTICNWIINFIQYYCILIEIIKLITFTNHSGELVDISSSSFYFINNFSLIYHWSKAQRNGKYPVTFIIVIVIIFACYLIYFNSKDWKFKYAVIGILLTNFFDLFIMKLFTIFIIEILTNYLLFYATSFTGGTGSPTNVIFCLMTFFLYCLVLWIYWHAYQNIRIYTHIQYLDIDSKYPFDYLSRQYDIVFLFSQVVLTLFNNIPRSNIYYLNFSKLFTAIIIVIVLYVCITLIYNLKNRPMLFFYNFTLHSLRFGFTLCCILNIFNSLFCSNQNKGFYYWNLIVIQWICLALVYFFDFDIFISFFNKNMQAITQCYLILIIKEKTNDIIWNYIEKIEYHCNLCESEFCRFCYFKNKIKDLPDDSINNKLMRYYTCFLNVLKSEIKNKKSFESIYYDIYLLLLNSFVSKTNRSTATRRGNHLGKLKQKYSNMNKCCLNYKERYLLVLTVNKYTQLNSNVAYTLWLWFSVRFETQEMFEFEILSHINVFISLKDKILKIIHKVMYQFHNQNISPSTFIELGKDLAKLRNKRHMNFWLNNEKVNDYTISLFTYIIEEITNIPVNKDRGMIWEEIINSEDVFSYNFKHCNNIIIKFDPRNNTGIIIKAGKDMIKFVGEDWLNLFPKEIRREGITKLIASWNQRNNIKEFDYLIYSAIKTSNENEIGEYLRLILNYRVLYQDWTNEMFISGEYKIGVDDIVITKINKNEIYEENNSGNKDKSFYMKVSEVDEETIHKFIQCKRTLVSANNIWTVQNPLKNMNSNQNDSNQIKRNKTLIQHKKTIFSGNGAINTCLREKTTTKYGSNEYIFAINFRDQRDYKNKGIKNSVKIDKAFPRLESLFLKEGNIIKLNQSETEEGSKKENNLSLSWIYSIPVEDNVFNVYSSLKTSTQKNTNDNTEENSVISDFNHQEILNPLRFGDTSSICNSLGSQNSQISTIFKEKNEQSLVNAKLYKKIQNRFAKITNITLIFCMIIIIFSVISLIVEWQSNENLLESYSVYTEFRALNRWFYNIITSILAVVCIGAPGTEGCVNYYQEYNTRNNNQYGITYPSFEYSWYENPWKIESFGFGLEKLKKAIYTLDDPIPTKIFNNPFEYSYWSIQNDELYVLQKQSTFVDALEILWNCLIILIDGNYYYSEPIYIFTWGSYDFSNVPNKDKLKRWQIEYYNLVINYQKYWDNWVNIQMSWSDNSNGKWNLLSYIVMIMLLISNIFHSCLFVLLYYFIYSFDNLLMMNTDKLMIKLHNDIFFQFYQAKYSNLQIWIKFYEKDPKIIIHNIQDQYSDFFKKQIQKTKSPNKITDDSEKPKMQENQMNLQSNFFRKEQYQVITNRFYLIIYVIISYYLIIFVLFLSVWKVSKDDIWSIYHIITDNTVAACSGYNVFALSQIMWLSNQTNSEISKNMNYPGNDYIFFESWRSLKVIIDWEIKRKQLSYLMKTTNDFIDLNCDTFYSQVKDIRFETIDSEHPDKRFRELFPPFCKTFNIIDYKNEALIYKNVFYSINKYVKGMKDFMSYDDYLKEWHEGLLYYMSDYQFLIYRPYRSWFNDVVYQDAIDSSINLEKTILFSILGITIASEIIIFSFLYFELFGKLKNINSILIRVKNVYKIIK